MRTIAVLGPCLLGLCLLSACRPAAETTAGATPPASSPPATASADAAQEGLVARGEYLVRIAGCNDCHTAGYMPRGGDVPKDEWLAGSPLGYHGPWGTTYASNLRLTVDGLSETEWLDYTGKLHTRPIMPDFVLRQMREDDRRAIYHFVRSLGPAGEPARAALPPGETPPPPYFQLVEPVAATP
jgi:mono/diheme cytochrome c family protein